MALILKEVEAANELTCHNLALAVSLLWRLVLDKHAEARITLNRNRNAVNFYS